MTKRIFDIALAQAWAIDSSPDGEGRPFAKLRKILEIAAREHRRDELEALQFKPTNPLARAERAREAGNVAVVPIIGPTFPRANLMTDLSGATSLEMIGGDLIAALENPKITGVILDLDTPGGVFEGTNETAKLIARVSAESDKPIVAYVGGYAASAGYWLASATSRILVDESASLGSIGVVLAMVDTSARDQARGVREFRFVSSQSPLKRVDPESDDGAAVLQAKADDAAQIFIEAVAANRGVSVETVIEDFGQGGTLFGDAAVRAGMADQIASFDEVLAAVAGGEFGGSRSRAITSARRESLTMPAIKNAADLEAAYPELAGEIKSTARKEGHATGLDEGLEQGRSGAEQTAKHELEQAVAAARGEGAKAERERIASLKAASLPGYEKELEAAIADGSTAEQLALKIIAAQQKAGTGHLKQLDKDREDLKKAELPDNRDRIEGAGQQPAPKNNAQVSAEGAAFGRQIQDFIKAEKEAGRTVTPDEAAAHLRQQAA